MLDPEDTIAAIASPMGPAVRGLVRVTGPRAWEVVQTAFAPDETAPSSSRGPRAIHGQLRVDGLRSSLPAMVVFWPGRRTYTGQPLAEIHTVGSPPVIQAVLAHYLAHGARLAEPGEFTLRGFLSGRIDLTQAEAVLGVIDAQTPAQLETALRQLAGGLAGVMTQLRNRLLDVLAHLEAGLDFLDEPDVDPLERARLSDELRQGADDVSSLLTRMAGRDRPEGLPRVVLVGPPNAGKSRLFNALVGPEFQAIVSPVAGTTRDYLSSRCLCGGWTIELIDTAGAEPAHDTISEQSQSRRESQMAAADLLLLCAPCDLDGPTINGEARGCNPRPLGGEGEEQTQPIAFETLSPGGRGQGEGEIEGVGRRLSGPKSLRVATKCDLGPAPAGAIPTSAETGVGLDALRDAIAAALAASRSDGDAVTATSARCRGSLETAHQALRAAAETLDRGGEDELVAIDLREALDELGKVVGAVVTDDILDRIFSRFCIGK